jgi:adenine/guanine phosphoribosyltransferase-like PRPP-binding protein
MNMNILDKPMEDIRRTEDGKVIQGSSHTCHVLNHKIRNKIIIKAVCDLRKIEHTFDSIACCGVSGMMVVPQIAELLNKHIVVVRKGGERCYSEFRTEGVAPFQYIILDDLICSGSTVKHIKRVLKNEYARSICKGVYCYLPNETSYRPNEDGSKLCQRDLGMPLLNLDGIKA